MKWGRAIGIAVLVWVLIFVEISVTMIGLKLPPISSWIVHYILLIPIIAVAAGL